MSLDNREEGFIAGRGGIMLEAAARTMAEEFCGSQSCGLCLGGKFDWRANCISPARFFNTGILTPHEDRGIVDQLWGEERL